MDIQNVAGIFLIKMLNAGNNAKINKENKLEIPIRLEVN